jgi:hypothetical protein
MGGVVPTTSRRALLRALTAAPVMVPVIASPWGETLVSLHAGYGDDPAAIIRTKEGRALSRRRYHVAEGFFPAEHERADWRGYLYRAGITAQLALSSHLLDMGFGPRCQRRDLPQDGKHQSTRAITACGILQRCSRRRGCST